MTAGLPRVLLVTAEALGTVSGNDTTIRRFERRLRERGLVVHLARLPDDGGVEGVRDAAVAFRPDVVHALHARHAGPAAVEVARAVGVPLVVSSGGTDIDQDPYDEDLRRVVVDVLDAARVLYVAHEEAFRHARALGAGARVLRVPVAADPPPSRPAPDPGRFGATPQDTLFLLPAGVRPVKNNAFPLAPIARLHAEGLSIRLVLAGPSRDEEYARHLEGLLAGHPCAAWIGSLAPQDLEVLYASADVVLNGSHSEGGANAVLEAMVRGKCVLASSVPGNEGLLEGGEGRPEAGRLYRAWPTDDPRVRRHDADDFLREARDLAVSPSRRHALGARARERATVEHSPEGEVEALLVGYRVALAGERGPSARREGLAPS
ncbi:MAG TPA: glycosyltransferase [Planctomycetota bacterium]|nr:glycosyltransferase [Planctomycetota bacterium]